MCLEPPIIKVNCFYFKYKGLFHFFCIYSFSQKPLHPRIRSTLHIFPLHMCRPCMACQQIFLTFDLPLSRLHDRIGRILDVSPERPFSLVKTLRMHSVLSPSSIIGSSTPATEEGAHCTWSDCWERTSNIRPEHQRVFVS